MAVTRRPGSSSVHEDPTPVVSSPARPAPTSTRPRLAILAGANFAPNWAVKGEYMYYDFGTTRFTTPVALAPFGSFRTDDHTLKLGVNYRFNFASPVVARY